MTGVTSVQERAPEPDRDTVDFTWLGEWMGRHGPLDDRLVMAGGVLVAIAVAVWMTAGAWGPRPISGEDSMAHLVRAEFAIRNVFSAGRLDGWHPGFITGYQEFLFIGPGFTMAVALVHWLTFGMLSVAGALKFVVLASFAALPLSVAFLARSVGLSRRAAGVAAVLCLAVNNPFGGVGVQGLFNVGLLTHQFSAPLFFLTVGSTIRLLRADPGRRWTAATAVSLAALLCSHGISVIILGGLLVITMGLLLVPPWRALAPEDRMADMVRREVRAQLADLGLVAAAPDEPPATDPAPDAAPRERPTQEGVRRVVVAYAIAAALAAFVLLPFVGHRNLRGIFTAWGTPPFGQRLTEIWRGQLLFRPGVPVLLAIGLGYGIVRVVRGRPYALLVAALPLVALAASHVAIRMWPASVVTPQLTNRSLGYLGVLAVLPLAALLARVTRHEGILGDLAALAVAVGIVVVPLNELRDMARESPVPIPQMGEAARELARIVPDGARFVTQRNFPTEIERTKLVNPDRWLAWASGRNTLNNFNVESSMTPGPAYESEHLTDRTPEVIADALSRLGTTHMVTTSDEAADRFVGSPRFTVAWRSSPIAIFGVRPRDGQPDPAALVSADVPIEARLVRAEPEHVAVDVGTDRPATATVPIGWSPKWHARLDGRDVALRKGPEGLLTLSLPPGEGRLTLDFRRDLWDYAGMLVSVVTAGAGIRWLVRSHRARRTAAGPAPVLTPASR